MLLDLKRRLILLILVFIVGYFIFGLISSVVLGRFGVESTPAMRIIAVFQDIILFIMPAIVTALIITRRPAQLLAIDSRVPSMPMTWGLCAMLASIPAMNVVIWLNQQLPLPSSMADTMQQLEANAAAMVKSLQGPHTLPNLLMSVLIVGIFAGFSEELIFRGALQRILSTGGVRQHAAIWIAAFIFSLLHMQIYGFIPRMLLGAMFGYALWWTGCLWVPVIMHVFNNTLFLVGDYTFGDFNQASAIASATDAIIAVASAACTTLFICLMRKSAMANAKHPEP